jgi:fucose permease
LIVGGLLLNVAAELSFAGWIHTYCEDVGLGAATATGATAAFWAAFVTGRLLSVFLARRMTSAAMLSRSAMLALAGGAVMAIGRGSPTTVWPGVVLIGLGLAPQFPMTIAFGGERFAVTAAMMSRFVAAAGAASLVFPFLTGRLIDASGTGAFPVTVSVILAANLVWVVGSHRRMAVLARSESVTSAPAPAITPEAPHTL